MRQLLIATVALVLLQPALAASADAGDAIAGLTAKLDSFKADAPFSGTLAIRQSSTDGKGDDATTTRGHVAVRLRDNSDGLAVVVPADELARIRAEKQTAADTPGGDTGSAAILDSFSLQTAQAMVDFAPVLKKALASATLRSQKQTTRDGKPAQLLVFDVPLSDKAREKNDIDEYSSTLQLWLGDDDVPLALDVHTRVKVSKFLISFRTYTKRSCRLQLVGTRLICSQRHMEQGGAGMGQSGKSVSDSSLTPVPSTAMQQG